MSTVDPEEVQRFNALASTWWDPQGPMWPLHRLNALRVPYLSATIARHYGRDPQAPSPLQGLRLLDIGCGAGLLAEAMARLGAQVTGVDAAGRNIDIARHHAATAELRIDYRCGSIDELANEDPFDAVLNLEVVEHVTDLPAFIEACCRCTAAGGLMCLSTINRTPASYLAAIIGAEYVLRWLPRGTHQWRRFVTPEELAALLEPCGFTVLERRGVRINPLTRHYRLGDRLSVNYLLTAARGPASTAPR